MARKLVPKLVVIFRHLVFRLADVDPVPKESSSSYVGDYRPISITSVLSNGFQKILAGNLSYF